jgi:hypothetical protein
LGTGRADVNVLRVDGAEAALFMTDGAVGSLGTYRIEQLMRGWSASEDDVRALAAEWEAHRQNVGDDLTLVGVSLNIKSG